MRIRCRRFRPGRTGWSAWPHRRGKRTEALFSLLIGVGLALLTIHFINAQLRPVMTELASVQVQNAVTTAINKVVSQEISDGNIAFDDVVQLDKDGSGNITALKNDMARVNVLRANILSALVQAVGEVDSKALKIPLGNLSGIDLLSGRGPSLSVQVLTAGTPDAAFRNVFSDAGINQTRHQIVLDVIVPVSILLPGFRAQTDVTAQVCVAETIIVGKVPNTYLQWKPAQ